MKGTIEDSIRKDENFKKETVDSIQLMTHKLKSLCQELNLNFNEFEPKLVKVETMIEKKEFLNTNLTNLETEKKKRLKNFRKIAEKENQLCIKLCLRPTEMNVEIPNENELNQLCKRICELEDLHEKQEKQMSQYQQEIIRLSDKSEVLCSNSFAESLITKSVNEMSLGELDLKMAKRLCNELKHREDELNAEIRSLGILINQLWVKLDIKNSELQSSINVSRKSCTIASKSELVKKLRTEYERCLELKKEHVPKCIEAIRVQILLVCNKMFFGESEMASLNENLLAKTDLNEDLLELHEKKLEDLNFYQEENNELYQKLTEWKINWKNFLDFEKITEDPSRLKDRTYKIFVEEDRRKELNVRMFFDLFRRPSHNTPCGI